MFGFDSARSWPLSAALARMETRNDSMADGFQEYEVC